MREAIEFMIKEFLFSLGFISSNLDIPKQIEWTPIKLSVQDFKMNPPKSSAWAGLTTSTISMNTAIDETGKFSFDVHAFFNPSQSWLRLKNDYILNHEQKHFDITEYFARQSDRPGLCIRVFDKFGSENYVDPARRTRRFSGSNNLAAPRSRPSEMPH